MPITMFEVLFLGWLWSGVVALPVWVLWSACGLGQHFFSFLPAPWLHPSLLEVIGLSILVVCLRAALTPLRVEATLEKD